MAREHGQRLAPQFPAEAGCIRQYQIAQGARDAILAPAMPSWRSTSSNALGNDSLFAPADHDLLGTLVSAAFLRLVQQAGRKICTLYSAFCDCNPTHLADRGGAAAAGGCDPTSFA
jgi:hypothetical protein